MQIWLRCNQASEGMFPNEIGVESENSNRQKFSLFVDKRIIKKENGELYLKVSLLEKGKKESTILLPSDPYGVNSRIVVVPNSLLKDT